jgi:hypothetical protein
MPLSYRAYAFVGKLAARVGIRLHKPLFIIGTGRCGTTLLARILNSHRCMIGFSSEANELWHPRSYPFRKASLETPPIHEDPRLFTEISLRNWPEGHEAFGRAVFTGFYALRGRSRAFFVKSAMVSFMVPKILALFADARFIHIYRHGPSVVNSMYKKENRKYQHRETAALEQKYRLRCAKYWNDCVVEVDRASKALRLAETGRMHECSYEALCDDPRGTLGQLTAYLGLDPALLSFDFSQVRSRHYKGEYERAAEWAEALALMQPALALKGYA